MTTAEPQPSAVDQLLHAATAPTYNFAFSDFLKREYRFGLDPTRPLCKAFLQGHCPLGPQCPDKHDHPSNYNKYVSLDVCRLRRQRTNANHSVTALCANIGYAVFAKRETVASFFTNSI